MHKSITTFRKPITLDSLDDLFAHHRAQFAGWRMENEGSAGESVGDTPASEGNDWKPPASQAELDRIVQERLSRLQKQYGMTPEEAKSYKERQDSLEHELSSEADKAAKKAADEARADERNRTAPALVRQAFRAEAKGVLSKEALDGLLEDYNPKNYIDDNGDVDEAKVAARVAKFATSKDSGGGAKPQPRPLAQGHQSPAQQSARDLGRAEAEKRFGKK